MKTLITFCLFFFLSVGISTADMHMIDKHEDREPTALEKETFDLLKKKFPGEILDENLKTVHELAESLEYKTFLEKAYPDAKPIPAFAEIINFEEVIHKKLPPKERYLTYYTEQFFVQTPDEVTDAEHFLVHHQATGTWIYHAIIQGNDTPKRTEGLRLPSRNTAKLMGTPLYRKMLDDRFGIDPNEEMRLIMRMVVVHVKIPILNMTKTHLVTDAQWIASLLERHGTTDGMLWVALQDPILFERIRYAFTTDRTFLAYVHTAPIKAETDARILREIRERVQKEQSSP